MKKGKFFLSLLMAVMLFWSAFLSPILAEEDVSGETVEETIAETSSESEGPPSTYYEEIQSNKINHWPQGPAVIADAAILMDAETGAVLYAKDIEQRLYPASITKIMTVLIALENGKLDDIVTFSEYAVYSIEYGSSHLGMTEGEQLTMEQCLYGIMLASANEVSNAVAEHIGGSINGFVKMMNDRAAQLGCTNTHFTNVHGLHEDDHYVCARDMALIMQAAVKIDKFREIISTTEYHFPKTNLVDEERYFVNHHKMIMEDDMLYKGCVGGKTGFTDQAGNTLVTYAVRGRQSLICVVLRDNNLYAAYDDTRALLDYGFDSFGNRYATDDTLQDAQIVGVASEQEQEQIKNAGLAAEQFTLTGNTKYTLPAGGGESPVSKTLDVSAGLLTYRYEDQVVGSVPFTYTGVWQTEAPTEISTEALSETASLPEETTQIETHHIEQVHAGEPQGFVGKFLGGLKFLYGQMDTFIEENTVVAAILGAVLLLVFVPLLLLAVNRHRKYLHILELRREDLKIREQLEREIEEKSAAQVEAELRARELAERLAEEKNKRKDAQPEEEAEDFYLDEEAATLEEEAVPNEKAPANLPEEAAWEQAVGLELEKDAQAGKNGPEEEDEYIEVSLEDEEEPLD